MTTTPKKDDTKKADDVIDVETTEVGPPTRLPPLKAPTIEPLGGWKQVRNYLINNLVHSHVYGFSYQKPSRTLGAYYAQFSELQLPPTTDSDSDSEEELQSMIETHNMWSPFHYDYVQDVNPPRTYYICVGDTELQAWEDSQRATLRLSAWKSTTSRVFQHIHLHEHPIEALNYIVVLIHNSMSTTLPPSGGKASFDSFQLVPGYYDRKASHGVLPKRRQRLQGAGEPQRLPTGVGQVYN